VTKAKAVELLNELFDSYLTMEEACLDTIIKVDGKQFTLRDKLDEITDRKIALLTAIDALEQDSSVKAEPDNGWISVKDRLPEIGEHYRSKLVMCYTPDGEHEHLFDYYEVNGFGQGCFTAEKYFGISITHWMPLPQKPESEDEK
jgi:hypothetical protein